MKRPSLRRSSLYKEWKGGQSVFSQSPEFCEFFRETGLYYYEADIEGQCRLRVDLILDFKIKSGFRGMISMANVLKMVPVALIRENPNALRKVNRSTEEYQQLVDSISARGVLNPIVVRECYDKVTEESFYGLIDGLHRFSGAQDAGLTEVPANVIAADEADVMLTQIITNIQKIETKPVEYSKQLVKILALNPLLTKVELAGSLKVSLAWLDQRLGLVKLAENLHALVDEGKIALANAYSLSKLPTEDQTNFLDQAITMQAQEFLPLVNARVKELRDAKRQGRDPNNVPDFVATPRLRNMSELKSEYENGQVARVLTQSIDSVVDAFKLGVAWAIHMDSESVAARKAKDDARKAQLAEEKELRKREREAKKEKEAVEKAARAQEALVSAN